jgi:hypothetical protein
MSKLSIEQERISASDKPKENPYKVEKKIVSFRERNDGWQERSSFDNYQSGDRS